MKVTLNAGDSIEVPENCKVVEKNGMVFFEPVSDFKKGDFVHNKSYGSEAIYYGTNKSGGIITFAGCRTGNTSYEVDEGWGHTIDFRLATESEKQRLIDALHAENKDWDAEKCEIVDLKYIPKDGDCVWCKDYIFIAKKVQHGYESKGNYINGDKIISSNDLFIGSLLSYTKLTPKEFQAEFNKLGYEYDFETNTAKKLEWRPKMDEPYYLPAFLIGAKCCKTTWCDSDMDNMRLKNKLIRQTPEEAGKLTDKIIEFVKSLKE